MTSMGPFDLTITFQRMGEFAPGQIGIIDQVAVSFSPQQFKALARSMTEVLGAYERSFGELAIPDLDTRPNKTADELEKMIASARSVLQQQAGSSLSSSEHLPPSSQSASAPRKKGRPT